MTDSKRTRRRELREFGLLMGGVIAGLFGAVLPWLLGHAFPHWPWVVAAGFVLVALLAPNLLQPVRRAWLAFGHVLGWINTRVLLGLLFYLVLAPIGLIMRLAGHDPMRRYLDAGTETYREKSRQQPTNHFERPF
jgi:hypothetical protein